MIWAERIVCYAIVAALCFWTVRFNNQRMEANVEKARIGVACAR